MSAKYQAYAEYKDSGVEWLGKLPKHWKCIRLKYVAELEGEKIEPSSQYQYVGMENVEPGNGRYLTKEDTNPEGLSTSFLEGDVLFGKLRPYLAKSWLANFSGICSSEFLVLRSRKVNSKFLNYYTLTDEFINQVDSSTYGSKMPRASWDFISLMGVPVPEYEDSQKIANFLDHETAKIDTLIEKQQQLIKLLKEKRQAVISHAVTKGLNPNAPMRDSGVEWLGDVPEHWDFGRLIYMCDRLVDGTHHSPESHFQGDYLYITAKNIKESGFDFSEITYITTKDHKQIFSRCSVQKGDVLYIKDGATAGIAMVNDLDDEFSLLSSVALIRPIKSKIISSFLAYHLNASQFKNNVLNQLVGGAITRFTLDMISRFILSLPPIDEQNEIVEFLAIKTAEFSILVDNANKAINLMKERRTALISAAVTGKIDVRNWQAPNKASKEVSA